PSASRTITQRMPTRPISCGSTSALPRLLRPQPPRRQPQTGQREAEAEQRDGAIDDPEWHLQVLGGVAARQRDQRLPPEQPGEDAAEGAQQQVPDAPQRAPRAA